MNLSTSMQQTATTVQTGTSPRIWVERILWASWVPLVLFTVFFTSIPDIHNGVHPIRHSTTIVQCH